MRATCFELEFLRVIWAATLAALAEEEDNSEAQGIKTEIAIDHNAISHFRSATHARPVADTEGPSRLGFPFIDESSLGAIQ